MQPAAECFGPYQVRGLFEMGADNAKPNMDAGKTERWGNNFADCFFIFATHGLGSGGSMKLSFGKWVFFTWLVSIIIQSGMYLIGQTKLKSKNMLLEMCYRYREIAI